jgi:hypothetical protein
VQDANLEHVPGVDCERLGVRSHRVPPTLSHHLQASDVALVQNSDEVGVVVGDQPRCQRRIWTWRVMVQADEGGLLGRESPRLRLGTLHSQAAQNQTKHADPELPNSSEILLHRLTAVSAHLIRFGDQFTRYPPEYRPGIIRISREYHRISHEKWTWQVPE